MKVPRISFSCQITNFECCKQWGAQMSLCEVKMAIQNKAQFWQTIMSMLLCCHHMIRFTSCSLPVMLDEKLSGGKQTEGN